MADVALNGSALHRVNLENDIPMVLLDLVICYAVPGTDHVLGTEHLSYLVVVQFHLVGDLDFAHAKDLAVIELQYGVIEPVY